MPTGFFGKMPAAGDFVARGLPPGLRGPLDRWLTQHLALPSRDPESWPPDGLFVLLARAEGAVLMLIVPSCDAPGREYPLAAVSMVETVGLPEARAWGAQVLPHLDHAVLDEHDPESLAAALAPLTPARGDRPVEPPLAWADGITPDLPEVNLPRLVPSYG